MPGHRTGFSRWLRRSRVWWFETPRAEIVRMVILFLVIALVAAGLVLLVVLKDS